MSRFVLLIACAGLCWMLAGCRSTSLPTMDEQFGVYYPDDDWYGGRKTLRITPAPADEAFYTFPAVFDSVMVRVAPFDSVRTDAVPVEVLVKGALIDDCSALHAASASRTTHFIDAELLVRRPAGRTCRRVERLFRYYLPLDEPLPPGAYTLRLNGGVFPFVVPAPEEG